MIKTLIFDLGNVVLGFDHHIISHRLSLLTGLDEGWLYRFLFESGLDRPLNQGRITLDEFLRKINEGLGSCLEIETFKGIWNDMFFSPSKEMESLLFTLKRTHTLYLLSNTNEPHFQYLITRYSILNIFDEYILSYKVGYTKPDKEIFFEALRRSHSLPNQCLFIDDIKEYVDAAKALGMNGIHFKGVELLKEELKGYGVL